MKKIITIVLVVFVIGLAVFLLRSFTPPYNTSSYSFPADRTQPDQSLTDILPIQPESQGDIPEFVELLRTAFKEKDIEICNSLPSPQRQEFFFGDYTDGAPSLNQWETYCIALVEENPSKCQDINRNSHPNLKQECLQVLEKIFFQKNDNSYTVCYEQIGHLYMSSDEVRNCLVKHELDNAPEFYRDLLSCGQKNSARVNHIGSERDACLFDLAKTSKLNKVCDLIGTIYSGYRYNVPDCKSELSE